ncbi:methyltransferase family protein [Ilumatobacter fluminis]|uniref:Methyltransferase family protein n=1 Tax=Ilumatobacter fluminis TaxID=467091 RepID=A0A4R7HYJ6_9ACTN|nr:methyltransferase family protein [Ilumatobacter fluminis]
MVSDGAFDETVAPRYDDDCADMFTPEVLEPTVALLAELAGGRPALEFAVGTGRVALPLADAGIEVHGIELSRAMVAEMRAKPGGDAIPVTIGDMATTRIGGEFGLVYLVFNTITNLLTQNEQVDCFRNAAAHLVPGGCFVIETGVPRIQDLPRGERFLAFDAGDEHGGIDEYDVVGQRLVSHHYRTGDCAGRFSSEHRWAWPAEYDLMARIAGLRLRDRWADWHRSPFTDTSRTHISVWHSTNA